MKHSTWTPLSNRFLRAPALAFLVAFAAPQSGQQEGRVVRGTPAALRVGGMTSLSHDSRHEHGLRVLGSVRVGPPVTLLEGIHPYAAGELVVPITYSFLFLQGSTWRAMSDGLHFRRPEETDSMGLKDWVRTVDAAGEDDGRWEVDISIRPRDELSWSEVQTKLDVTVNVAVTRDE